MLNLSQQKKKKLNLSESNYHTTKFFKEYLLGIEMKTTEVLMNKTVYLGLSMQELNEILTYAFWHDYVKPKYGKKAKLCYMYTVLLYT